MSVPAWQPGTIYVPGSLVKPVTVPSPVSTALQNPGFESGDTGWTKDAGWSITTGGDKFQGAWSAEFNTTAADVKLANNTVAPVTPGKIVTAGCYVQQGGSSSGQAGAKICLQWFDQAMAPLSLKTGQLVSSGSGGQWKISNVSSPAPGNAAFVQIVILAYRNSGSSPLWVDNVTWNVTQEPVTAGLIYKAVQDDPGTSGSSEPSWPPTLGVQVVDNQVTWEAVLTTRVTWQASPIMTSGATEPVWPEIPGAFVADNEISWEAIGLNIQDEKCPNSKVVGINSSKVFAADKDIVAFSATANPLDWSSENDAGYLPTGIQQTNSNDAQVINIYRSNIVVFNAGTVQVWQTDEDPAAMRILDQMDGIGSVYQHAACSVVEELIFLSQRGIRTVSTAVGSTNLAAPDIGAPIDPMVVEALMREGYRPVATFYPGAGQYWIAFGDEE